LTKKEIYNIIMLGVPAILLVYKAFFYIFSEKIDDFKGHFINSLKDFKELMSINLSFIAILHTWLYWEGKSDFSDMWLAIPLIEVSYYIILNNLKNIFLESGQRIAKDKRFGKINKIPLFGILFEFIYNKFIGVKKEEKKPEERLININIDIENNDNSRVNKNIKLETNKKLISSKLIDKKIIKTNKPMRQIKEVNNTEYICTKKEKSDKDFSNAKTVDVDFDNIETVEIIEIKKER